MFRLALLVLVVAGVIRYAWVILAVVAAAALLWWFVQRLDRFLTRRDAKRAARMAAIAAVAARADQQHAWVLAGDDRGMYGNYPTAVAQ